MPSIERGRIQVSGMVVETVRKDIQNLHLGVYPPNGRVRVAAPLAMNHDAVRLAVIGKLPWIRKQQAAFAAQPRQAAREMVSGESHYFLGRRYRLQVLEHTGPSRVVLRNRTTLELQVPPQCDTQHREQLLQRWYRQRLRELVPPLLIKWETKLGVSVASWGIKKMKTKWGSCSRNARRLWFNLELAKKPEPCLEYLIVHELLHLIEPHHNDRFVSFMDRHLPRWQIYRKALNMAPLGHADWCSASRR